MKKKVIKQEQERKKYYVIAIEDEEVFKRFKELKKKMYLSSTALLIKLLDSFNN
jgi:hypothetical protein